MTDNPHYLRLAYADPPYPGQSKRYYGDQPSYAGEVDHAALIERLSGYDGWASAPAFPPCRGCWHSALTACASRSGIGLTRRTPAPAVAGGGYGSR